MASGSHRLEPERATVPPITLPITSRGLVVTDRVCWAVLAAAMVAAAGLILYLNRGTTFYLDELRQFYVSPDLGLRDAVEPVNGHLVLIPQLYFKALFEAFGAHYEIIRVLHVAMLALTVGLLYALIKRRIGALPALAPALVLLVLGAAWNHVVIPQGLGIFISISAGLAALLALEREDRRGEIAACALLVLSIATFTIGLAFLVGVAISVLLREDRWRRAWIFLIPAALYAIWWLWSVSQPSSAEGATTLSNVLLVPSYVMESLAAVTAALTGLAHDFDAGPRPVVELGWGRVLAVVAIAGLALRISRGRLPRSLWAGLGIVLTYWAIGALAFEPLRPPGSGRYIFMGAVGVLLVATDAARPVRFGRVGIVALFAVCAVAILGNLADLRTAGAYFRNYSVFAGTQFAMLELARDDVDPGFDPADAAVPTPFALVGARAGRYFAAADEYGSLADPLSEVERRPPGVRENADLLLATALELRLRPAKDEPAPGECTRFRGPGGRVEFELPPGGAILETGGGAANVSVGRFADAAPVELGRLEPDQAAALRVPTDSSTRPWQVAAAPARSVEVCPL